PEARSHRKKSSPIVTLLGLSRCTPKISLDNSRRKPMHKAIAIALLALLLAVAGWAQSENAAELATQQAKAVNKVLTTAQWTTLLSADFKKPGTKDLLMLVSIVCGLFTGNASEAFASTAVAVRELVVG